MRLDRRTFVTGAAAMGGVAGLPRRARAAVEFSLKAANNLPEGHPSTARMREAAANILRDSNGLVEVQIFPSGQLGSDTEMLSQLRSGALELFSLSPLILSTVVPNASITGLGFIWSGYDKIWSALDGELGILLREQVRKAGLYPFARIWENGFRHVTSSTRPILVPDDLRGFKIRVPTSPIWTSMFKAFDAVPMSINFNGVYSALQSRVAEGQENPLVLIETAKLYEVQKYLALTGHMWDGFWLLANGRAWSNLPLDVQQLVERHFNAAAIAQRADIAGLNETTRATLANKGMEISSVDVGAFRNRLDRAGFYRNWRAAHGEDAWRILERYTGPIT